MKEKVFYLSQFDPKADGETDDTKAFLECFKEAAQKGIRKIIIESATYYLKGEIPIPLYSDLEISADNAIFMIPKEIAEGTHCKLFYGKDISNLRWHGGKFIGYVYDVNSSNNSWAPNVNVRCIVIESSENAAINNLDFIEVKGENIAGAVITVLGYSVLDGKVKSFAKSIRLINCTFDNCGKFMWDYGYLWQRIVFQELYSEEVVKTAYYYMPKKYISGNVAILGGTDYVTVENLPLAVEGVNDQVVFFNDVLPKNIKKGKSYWVVNEDNLQNRIWISEEKNGVPIVFKNNGGKNVRLFRQLHSAFYVMYQPEGAGPGKGAFDLTACKNIIITGCRLSAPGDTMHIHSSKNINFTNNQIIGSRMGAFFIAEYCSNVTVTGNTVQGTNGSRVMSVERSSKNITISGNTFIGGGRGSWINQPNNFILSDNIFIENTTKGEEDLERGRIRAETGEYEKFPEIYFTTWQENAKYGPIIIKGNIIYTGKGCSAALAFHSGGENILVYGNVIKGTTGKIMVENGCEKPNFKENIGITEIVNEINNSK